ncbi:MAG TPA: adenosylcobalamin-dependent ribonucleoside-diphosphate reductase [Gammaproteobacteria bacterium]|nr:adenosylcobalamin-dependent ribonucleoside-diphosphate reductase [Gammaproteobacteria bacterium]
MTEAERISLESLPTLPLQPASQDIWARKYRLSDASGKPLDATPDDSLRRVARALAAQESSPELVAHWEARFLWALRNGAIPAGRILANAGAEDWRGAASTINCTVSGTIHDSMDDILARLHEAGMTLKAGAGIGYEFSTLRPRDAWVAGAGARTSGPLSFMDIYDRMCMTISSAGGRRGAQMATFDVSHPDVRAFIDAKRENGRLRMFNLSLLVTDAFMRAVESDAPWPLVFPASARELEAAGIDPADPARVLWRPATVEDDYLKNDEGLVAHRIYEIVQARALWDAVMRTTYDYAEPGIILIDRYNEFNNNWFCERIRATNPCGEQGLPPYGACLLGSIDLTRFVIDPFADSVRFDWPRYREVVAVFTRMLDNVVGVDHLPLPAQREELRRKRRHGMGFLGLGSMLAMLRLRYGSAPAIEFTEQLTRELAVVGWRTALALAKEKGAAPLLDEDFTVTAEMLRLRPEMAEDGLRVGDRVKGRVLHAKYSRYMQALARVEPVLVAELAEVGARFTHHSSIAPTGTIALSFANNASNGIEPSFAHRYVRNIIREGRKTKEAVDVLSLELLAWRTHVDPDADEHSLPDWFVTANDVSPAEHLAMQAAAQRWIDSSISKTINVPTDLSFDDFKSIYLDAWRCGLKGCTTFRYNPAAFQGVLVRPEELARTRYRFTLDDGTTLEFAGDDEVEYEGQITTAANLYDALKEGYYGRY